MGILIKKDKTDKEIQEEIEKLQNMFEAEKYTEIDKPSKPIITEKAPEKPTTIKRTEDQNKLRKVNEPFIGKGRTKNPKKPKEELKTPLLLLMKQAGYIEIIEGAKAGQLILETPEGEKEIHLVPKKLMKLKYNNQYWDCWVAHEDHPLPFPYTPLQTSTMLRQIISKISMNYKEADQQAKLQRAIGIKWLLIILALALGAYLLYSSGIIDAITAKESATQVAQHVAQNTPRIT